MRVFNKAFRLTPIFRFASTRSRKLFPSWIRSAVEVFDSPKSLFAEVERFFVERGVLVERAHAKALQQYNQSLSSTDLQRKRKSVDGILENSQKALDDIVNLYGDALRSSQGQLQKRAKPVEQDATTSNVSNVDLEKLIHTLVGIVVWVWCTFKRGILFKKGWILKIF